MRSLPHIACVLVAVLVMAMTPGWGRAWAAGPGPDGYSGSLAIGIHPAGGTSPVCFTLTDPLGRRMSAGPPCGEVELAEIPDAYHDYESIDDDETGAPGPVTRVIFIAGPLPGAYTLKLSLPQDAGYDIEVQGTDEMDGTSHKLVTGINAEPGSERTYIIKYTDFPAAEVTIEER